MPEVGWGTFDVIDVGDRAVLALRYDWGNNAVLFLHNLAPEPREVTFSVGLKDNAGNELVNLLSADHSTATRGKHRVCVEGCGYRWYRVGGLDYLLKRSEF